MLSVSKPKNVSELKSLLGLINCYHSHFKNVVSVLEPLLKFLRKDVRWKWGVDQDDAFRKTKEMLSDSNLLVHYDKNKSLVLLACDASPYGLGAVLLHVMNDGSDRPTTFACCTLKKAEQNYFQIEKEGLAIVYAVKKFHQYV